MEVRPSLTAVESKVAARPVPETADYGDFDLPPGRRRQATGGVDGQAALQMDEDLDEQLFDVPAFLRRQAD